MIDAFGKCIYCYQKVDSICPCQYWNIIYNDNGSMTYILKLVDGYLTYYEGE